MSDAVKVKDLKRGMVVVGCGGRTDTVESVMDLGNGLFSIMGTGGVMTDGCPGELKMLVVKEDSDDE